jgi:hypothetical protein
MTARAPVETNLIVGIVLPLYQMIEEDITALAARLTRQMTIEYRQVIQGQLVLYGCQKLVTGPDAISQRWIEAYAKKNSEGIARTYNRELSNKISALYQANPRGNRRYYARALDAWILKRNSYKLPSIALNTAAAIREYAQQRFREENGIEGRFLFVGPPPVCEKCLRLKSLGVVTEAEARRYGNSQHVGCPHEWEQLIPKKIDCDEAWTG